MNKIKIDPLTLVVIALALLIVFALGAKYFESAKNRIAELEVELQRELYSLELSLERQEELTQKAIKSYRVVISLAFFVFGSLIVVAVMMGMSYANALEVHIATVGFAMTMVSVIFFNTWNPDSLLNALKQKIKKMTYKRNGFNPDGIDLARMRVRDINAQLTREYMLSSSEEVEVANDCHIQPDNKSRLVVMELKTESY